MADQTNHHAELDSDNIIAHDVLLSNGIEEINGALIHSSLLILDAAVDRAAFADSLQKVIVALATLQSSVQDLSRAYINHANTVLNPGRSGPLDIGLTSTLLEAGLLSRTNNQEPILVEEPAGDTKKKRKRAKHDPNAPKRALTPYFL